MTEANSNGRYSNVRSTPAWAKELEAELAAGKTLVTFTAAAGNDSDSCSLTVRVRDAVPPRVYNCPSDFNVYLDEGQVKRQVRRALIRTVQGTVQGGPSASGKYYVDGN